MLSKILFFGLCVLLSSGLSFEEEATSLLQTHDIDLSDMAAASTSKERKDALQAALALARVQLTKQIADVKKDFGVREGSRVAARNAKLAAAATAKTSYEAALKTYQTLQALSVRADQTYTKEQQDDLEETNRLVANVDRVIGALAGLLNGKPVGWALDGWTGWVNGWDAPLNQGTDPARAFCGFGGVHNNGREDRLFKLRRCRPITSGMPQATSNQQIARLAVTPYQQSWTRQCGTNQFIGTIYSVHDNGKEDRQWTFGCKSFAQVTIKGCSWTGWLNGWDAQFYYTCPGGTALAGLRGEYNPGARDRRFGALCCSARRSYI